MDKELAILKALADKTRLKIVEFLLDGEKCVCEIFPEVKRTQSTVSTQLNILRKAEIVDSKKKGKKVYYSISNEKIYDIFNILGFPKTKLERNLAVENNSNCRT